MAKIISILGGFYIVCSIVSGVLIYMGNEGLMFAVLALSVIIQGFIVGGTAICVADICNKTANIDNDMMYIKSKLDDLSKK